MSTRNIMDVSEADFEYEVIAHSQQVPVVVDFWAEWCGPCRLLGPVLERLAEEADGRFRLAKVNVDENPNLAVRYNVRGIPAVKAFQHGQVVAEFTGAQPEPRVRDFLKEISPGPGDLALSKGLNFANMGKWEQAEEVLNDVLAGNPDHPAALLGMAKALLARGRGREAREVLKNFPASREFSAAEKLLPLATALVEAEGNSDDPDDFLQAAFSRALSLIGRGNFEAAMDALLDVIRQDKRFRNGEPRKIMLALFEILGEESAVTRQYRSELASALF